MAWASRQHDGLGSKRLHCLFKPSLRALQRPFCHSLLVTSDSLKPTHLQGEFRLHLWMDSVSEKLWACFKTTAFGYYPKTSHWSPSLQPPLPAQGVCLPSVSARACIKVSWRKGLCTWACLGVPCGSWIRSRKAGRVRPQMHKLLPSCPTLSLPPTKRQGFSSFSSTCFSILSSQVHGPDCWHSHD